MSDHSGRNRLRTEARRVIVVFKTGGRREGTVNIVKVLIDFIVEGRAHLQCLRLHNGRTCIAGGKGIVESHLDRITLIGIGGPVAHVYTEVVYQYSLPRDSLGRSRRIIGSGRAKDILEAKLSLHCQFVIGIIALVVADGSDFVIRPRIFFRHSDIVHTEADFRQHTL